MRFIFITKTQWNEPPRIRHQLTEALLKEGHEVVFFEKAVSIYNELEPKNYSEQFSVITPREISHHRLRFNLVMYVESLYQIYQYRNYKSQIESSDQDIIINFSYDSYFLRNVFPDNKIITFLNDDFEEQTKLWGYSVGKTALLKTIKMSNHLLSTSPLLIERYSKYIENSDVFLPWFSESVLKKTDVNQTNSSNKTILIWAFITDRIDFEAITSLLSSKKNISIDVYGPIHNRVKDRVDALSSMYTNINFFPSCKLDEIKLDRYFCTLTPYLNQNQNKTIFVTNKFFQLAKNGLPFINLGLPNFIEVPGVFNCNSSSEMLLAVDNCLENNCALRRDLMIAIAEHSEESRLKQLSGVINGLVSN